MGSIFGAFASVRHRVLPEKAAVSMAKADLGNPEIEWKRSIGTAVDACRRSLGLSIKEFAAKLPPPEGSNERDERQIGRWIAGAERAQLDVIFSVKEFREPFVLALAALVDGVEVVTQLTIRRRA